jgi:hypothetical protein
MYLPLDKAEFILKMPVDGSSVSAIERITGVHHEIQEVETAVIQDPEPTLPPPDPDPDPVTPPSLPEPEPDEPGPDLMPQSDPAFQY